MFSTLRRILYGFHTYPNELELRILAAYRSSLSAAASMILDEQLARYNFVQRANHDRMVAFYPAPGAPAAETRLFANRSEMAQAARLMLEAQGIAVTCRLIFTVGRISTLEFSGPPAKLASKADMHIAVLFVNDLMKPAPESRPKPSKRTKLSALTKGITLRNIENPAASEIVEEFKALWINVLPDEFFALLDETDGFEMRGWRISGTKSNDVLTPDGLFLVLGFRSGEEEAQFGVFVDRPRDGFFVYDVIDEVFTHVGMNLDKAFHFLSEGAAKA